MIQLVCCHIHLSVSFYIVTHGDERTAEDVLHRTYIAVWLLRLLKAGPYFPKDVKTPDTAEAIPSEGELFIGGLILHSLMLLQFNAHEVNQIIIDNNKILVFILHFIFHISRYQN